MNIKELRDRDALRLAERINPEPTQEQINEARHAMRIFYNFAAAYLSSFYINNDRRTTAEERTKADERSEKAHKKAAAALAKYNLIIECPGLYPIIDEANGANFSLCHYYR